MSVVLHTHAGFLEKLWCLPLSHSLALKLFGCFCFLGGVSAYLLFPHVYLWQ